jgi:hypothetical protein
MKKRDKLKNYEQANLMLEQSYLKSKGLLKEENTEELKRLKIKIQEVFPESLYGNYLSKLPTENVYKLYQVIDNNSQSMNDSALLDVLKGNEEKRGEVEKEKLQLYWLKSLISIVENGYFVDNKGKKYMYEFLPEKKETSFKQIMNNIKSKSNLIQGLVTISREKGTSISKLLSDKL